jgi:DNA repair exonuclease SbcCD ATPase subunit
VADSYDNKIERLVDRLEREERELREDESDLSQRKMEEWGTHAENVLGLFGGRKRRLSSSLSKRRMTGRARADVEESKEAIEDYNEDIAELEREKEHDLEEVKEKWSEIVDDMNEISVAPYKKDVLVELFGVAWMPNYAFWVGEEIEELPGYGAA